MKTANYTQMLTLLEKFRTRPYIVGNIIKKAKDTLEKEVYQQFMSDYYNKCFRAY
ncbi:hypothetical protein N9901_03115 [Flavobacteriaceae bacterium]|nr:hypothetical protein [Flavobacteriaceae bacterium]